MKILIVVTLMLLAACSNPDRVKTSQEWAQKRVERQIFCGTLREFNKKDLVKEYLQCETDNAKKMKINEQIAKKLTAEELRFIDKPRPVNCNRNLTVDYNTYNTCIEWANAVRYEP